MPTKRDSAIIAIRRPAPCAFRRPPAPRAWRDPDRVRTRGPPRQRTPQRAPETANGPLVKGSRSSPASRCRKHEGRPMPHHTSFDKPTREGTGVHLTVAFSMSYRLAVACLSFAGGLLGFIAQHLHWF